MLEELDVREQYLGHPDGIDESHDVGLSDGAAHRLELAADRQVLEIKADTETISVRNGSSFPLNFRNSIHELSPSEKSVSRAFWKILNVEVGQMHENVINLAPVAKIPVKNGNNWPDSKSF